MVKRFNKDGKRGLGDFTRAIMWACVVIVYLVVSVAFLYRFVGLWLVVPVPYFLYMLATSVRFGEDLGRGLTNSIAFFSGNKSIVIERFGKDGFWRVRLETVVLGYERKEGYHWEAKEVPGKKMAKSWDKKDGNFLVEKREVIRVDFDDYDLTSNDLMLLISALLVNRKDGIFNAKFLRGVLEIVVRERGHVRFVAFGFLVRSIRKRGHQAAFASDMPSPTTSKIGAAVQKYENELVEFENI